MILVVLVVVVLVMIVDIHSITNFPHSFPCTHEKNTFDSIYLYFGNTIFHISSRKCSLIQNKQFCVSISILVKLLIHQTEWREKITTTQRKTTHAYTGICWCVCGSQPIHCQFRLFVCVRFDLFCFSFIGVEWDKHTTQLNMSDPFQLTTIPFESLFCPWTLNAHCVCVCVYFKDLRKTKTLRISLCISVSRIRFTVIFDYEQHQCLRISQENVRCDQKLAKFAHSIRFVDICEFSQFVYISHSGISNIMSSAANAMQWAKKEANK